MLMVSFMFPPPLEKIPTVATLLARAGCSE
jgi:hypothetical protein